MQRVTFPQAESTVNWPEISFGNNILKPDHLSALDMGSLLGGIGGGQWADLVTEVRKLPYRSSQQSDVKQHLPYFTPSGLFSHRSARGLKSHSGHVAIDIDGLGEPGATAAIQRAVDDRFCVCAFRSVTSQGVRLFFRCPPCDAQTHKSAFACAASHVRAHYGLNPDTSGSDVARASFVSFDNGLWLNVNAVMLPALSSLATTTHKDKSLCVVSGLCAGDVETLAWGLGESRAPIGARADGTAFTHYSIMHLARDLVVRYQKHGLRLRMEHLDTALEGWQITAKRRGFRLSRSLEVYRDELEKAVRSVERVSWLPEVINLWIRWTRHPEFPQKGTSDERLLWAIGQHCRESGTNDFFLSARDAATITGTTFKAANNTLQRLVACGALAKARKREKGRKAQEYRLERDGVWGRLRPFDPKLRPAMLAVLQAPKPR